MGGITEAVPGSPPMGAPGGASGAGMGRIISAGRSKKRLMSAASNAVSNHRLSKNAFCPCHQQRASPTNGRRSRGRSLCAGPDIYFQFRRFALLPFALCTGACGSVPVGVLDSNRVLLSRKRPLSTV